MHWIVICSGTQSDIPARIVKVLKHYKYRKIMFARLHFFDLVLDRNYVLLFTVSAIQFTSNVCILFFRKCNYFLAFISYFVIGKLPVRERGEKENFVVTSFANFLALSSKEKKNFSVSQTKAYNLVSIPP